LKLSFRAKLIIAMTLIVTGVTGATLWVTQKRVRATYQRLFEQQFSLQINYFSENRIKELETVAAKCESVAKDVRVIAAVESVTTGDADPDIIYDNLDIALQGLNRTPTPASQTMRKVAGAVMRQRQPPPPQLAGRTPSVTVLDARGKILQAKKPGLSIFRRPTPGENRKSQERLFASSVPSDILKEQEIGYLATEMDGRGDPRAGGRDSREKTVELREFIVTPIINAGTEPPEHLGALIIGFPVHDFGEGAMYDFSESTLKSGIWLDRKIHTRTIPDAVQEEVAARVASGTAGSTTGTARETITLDGVPHLLFFKVLNRESIFPTAAQVCLYSMSEAVVEQAASRAQILGFGGLALLVGIGFILRISKGFSKPIEQLVEGTRRVQEGDFTAKVSVRSRDELGVLADSFNRMTDELALKERYKTVLAQVTDKQVAEELIGGKMTLGGEVKQVSVLFCDIRGFTALTENMPPGEVITMLNEHMTAMNRVVYKHYGMVDKFVGDLIMAVFGAPKSYGNDAQHAVKCALKMIEERKRLNETTKHAFEIGIGVATGEVVAGCMGSEDRLNYTVLGERVNLASRLCSKAGRTELLIDETTYSLLPEGFIAEATEPLPLKGYSAPVPAYRLIEMNGAASTEVEAQPVAASV
jgi:class 3 adenylate cyclase